MLCNTYVNTRGTLLREPFELFSVSPFHWHRLGSGSFAPLPKHFVLINFYNALEWEEDYIDSYNSSTGRNSISQHLSICVAFLGLFAK